MRQPVDSLTPMPQVDFYVLSDPAPDAHVRHACRIAEQAVEQGQTVFIRAPASDAKRIDDLLWTFGDRSFLPHEIATPTSPSHPRIRILIGESPDSAPVNARDVVINLGDDSVAVAAGARIAEFVPVDPERKRLARERFKLYRERGVEPKTHNV